MDVLTSAALIAAAGTILWTHLPGRTGAAAMRTPPQPTEPIAIDLGGANVMGSAAASTVLIEFSDFQCPFCSSFARETLPDLQKEFLDAGKVSLVFVHLPLAMHKFARGAAEAVECAGEQGRFWKAHDLLFGRPDELEARVGTLAVSLDLDQKRFNACLGGTSPKRVAADIGLAGRLGIVSTPSFVFGSALPDGRVKVVNIMSGAQPMAQFRTVLNGLMLLGARR